MPLGILWAAHVIATNWNNWCQMITCDNLTFQSKTNSYLRVSLFFGPHLLHFRFWARMAYEEKKKLLFDCLLTAEKSIAGTSLEQKESSTHHRPIRSDESKAVSRRFHGKESIFKRPAAPIAKCLKPRRAPDYQVRQLPFTTQHQFIHSSTPLFLGQSTQMEEIFVVRRWHFRSIQFIRCVCFPQGNRKAQGSIGRQWRQWPNEQPNHIQKERRTQRTEIPEVSVTAECRHRGRRGRWYEVEDERIEIGDAGVCDWSETDKQKAKAHIVHDNQQIIVKTCKRCTEIASSHGGRRKRSRRQWHRIRIFLMRQFAVCSRLPWIFYFEVVPYYTVHQTVNYFIHNKQ